MKRYLSLLLAASLAAAAVADETEAERRLATLKYGIEGQVVELIAALKAEKNLELKDDVLQVLRGSANPRIRQAALEYFAALELSDAEADAAGFVRDRDRYQESLVLASFSYLTAIRSMVALEYAVLILQDDERRYLPAAIRMIGASGGPTHAEALLALYRSDDATAAAKQEVLLALGKMKAAVAFELLASVARSEDAGKVERMYACAALGDLGDARAVPVLAGAASSSDPNVRAYAITALKGYAEAEARAAITEGLRDSHVAPRTAAAKAAGEAAIVEAVPFLEYKVRYDPEKVVRDASIDALALIGAPEALEFLAAFVEDTKTAAAHRARAFAALLGVPNEAVAVRLLAVFDAAAAEKDRNFFLALARAVVAKDDPLAGRFVSRLLADRDHASRLSALVWVERNRSATHADAVRALAAADPVEAVRKKAAAVLEALARP